MRFPDNVVLLHPRSANEYGDPARSFEDADAEYTLGFAADPSTLLLPASATPAVGDRAQVRGRTFEVAEVQLLRSPSRARGWLVTLEPIAPGAAS